ncbi:MAG TPA: L-seryl-tRNA(Sec) selenium transferase, partial [Limnochordales bacterium]
MAEEGPPTSQSPVAPPALRELPSVDRLLRHARCLGVLEGVPGEMATRLAREALAQARRQLAEGPQPRPQPQARPQLEPQPHSPGPAAAGERRQPEDSGAAQLALGLLQREARAFRRRRLVPVINATGVVLHTNLGRSPLPACALARIASTSAGYCNLELDLDSGRRGRREDRLEELLCALSGAEAAFVVNNNAAAVLLVLAASCAGREVVISRGELIEIGGEFRLPDVMAASGCRLVEVGTTNRTRLADYERAIGPQTAAILKAHTSNYRIVGFTQAVAAGELAQLAHRHGLWMLEDLGSGCLVDLGRLGLPREPTVAEAVAAGADAVMFSGDKLLGGPQAGIVVGRRQLLEQVRRHPLARAMRAGKLVVAALEAVLERYADGSWQELPVWRMLGASPQELLERARRLAAAVQAELATPPPAQAGPGPAPE